MKSIKRTLVLALALMLCLSLLPSNVFAEGEDVPATKKVVFKDSLVLKDNARTDQPQLPQPVTDPAFVFRSSAPFTLRTENNTANWDGELEYSTDARNWTLWRGETISVSTNNAGYRLYLRGSQNSWISRSFDQRWVLQGEQIKASGNIEYLLDYRSVLLGYHPQMGDYCYSYLFADCGSLITAPQLPAETLTEGCYNSMFVFCGKLTKAPDLPAKDLAPYCYSSMFESSGLVTAPDLPATALEEGCYCAMFNDCQSLTTLPVLSATELPDNCYFRMFSECPEIRLSEIKTEEYSIPFRIPDNGHVQYAGTDTVAWMFEHTGGPFTGTPGIEKTYYLQDPAKPLGGMLTFSSDTPFTLETYNSSVNWNGELEYSTDTRTWMLWQGERIDSAQHNGKQMLFLRGTGNNYISRNSNQRWVLDGVCVSCKGNIETLLDYRTTLEGRQPWMYSSCYFALFQDNTALIGAPRLPSQSISDSCYYSMFCGCKYLREAPDLPAKTAKRTCYAMMFYDCRTLKKAPVISAEYLDVCCFRDMFGLCTSLTEAPELPSTHLAHGCYSEMFYGCRSLKEAPVLNALTLAPTCYQSMFSYCTSLVRFTELPARDLPGGCYKWMYYGCSSIKLSEVETEEYTNGYCIPFIGYVEAVAPTALTDMFGNTGGPFTGTPEVNRLYYLHYTNNDWP